jgi:hypothetical protein
MTRSLWGVERLPSPKLGNVLSRCNWEPVGSHTAARSGACRSDIYEDTDTSSVPDYLATQSLRTTSIKPQFPYVVVSSVSFVSTTKTASSLAGCVLLALALTPWRSPGSSEKLCPAL